MKYARYPSERQALQLQDRQVNRQEHPAPQDPQVHYGIYVKEKLSVPPELWFASDPIDKIRTPSYSSRSTR